MHQAHPCRWQSPSGCVAAIPGSEVNWLLGRSGLAGSSGLSVLPGIWNGARRLGKPRGQGKLRRCSSAAQTALCFSPPAQGAVTRGTGYAPRCLLRDFSATQRLQVWLWTNAGLTARETERFQDLLRLRVSGGKAAPQAAGKVEQDKLRCLAEHMLVNSACGSTVGSGRGTGQS